MTTRTTRSPDAISPERTSSTRVPNATPPAGSARTPEFSASSSVLDSISSSGECGDRAAGHPGGADRELAVARIAHGQRAGDRVRRHARRRTLVGPRGGDRRATARLRSVHSGRSIDDEPVVGELDEALCDLREEGPGGDRTDDRVRRLPAQLLCDLVRDRLDALDCEGVQVSLEEAPREQVLELPLQAPAVLERPPHREDARAVGRGRKRGLVGVRRAENHSLEPCRGAPGRDCRSEVSGRGAEERLDPESLGGRQRTGGHSILEGMRRVRGFQLQVDVDVERRRDSGRRHERCRARHRRIAVRQQRSAAPERTRVVERAVAPVPDIANVERARAGIAARERRERMRRFADPAAEHRAVHSSASVNRASRRGG